MANGFNDVGFLGNDLDSWRDCVHAEFAESFAIADRMNRIGMRMIRGFDFDNPTEAQLLAGRGLLPIATIVSVHNPAGRAWRPGRGTLLGAFVL